MVSVQTVNAKCRIGDTADQIEVLREKVLAVLRRNDVKRAAFFGSIVRGELTDEGDVDILVELAGA
jgi:predicted nucleotidyltransferase